MDDKQKILSGIIIKAVQKLQLEIHEIWPVLLSILKWTVDESKSIDFFIRILLVEFEINEKQEMNENLELIKKMCQLHLKE